MSRFEYQVDESNVVRIYDVENPNENGAPFIYQPVKPDGSAWDNKEEAEAWAIAFIYDFENPVVVEEVSTEELEAVEAIEE